MTIAPHELILLDTNILVHWVRQDFTGRFLLAQYELASRPERPLLSTTVKGEILGLAMCWNWGHAKVALLEEILRELVTLEAGHPDVVNSYAELYFEDQRTGRNTRENDLWIAAAARASGAVLLTSDNDFAWMAPNLIRVEFVPVTHAPTP